MHAYFSERSLFNQASAMLAYSRRSVSREQQEIRDCVTNGERKNGEATHLLSFFARPFPASPYQPNAWNMLAPCWIGTREKLGEREKKKTSKGVALYICDSKASYVNYVNKIIQRPPIKIKDLFCLPSSRLQLQLT